MKSNKSIGGNSFLLEESILKLLFRYSVPAIIGMLVSALYNVVDRMFIGNIKDVGAIAITGIGVTLPFATIIIAFSMLLGVGSAANISIKLGKGKIQNAELIIGNTLVISFILGAILTVLGLIFCDEILTAFGASGESIVYAKEYMHIILWGNIFNIAGYALNGTIRTDGSPKISALIMIFSCLLNFVLDPLLIFKFNLGIKGAAYATVLSQLLTLALSLVYYLSNHSNMKIRKKNLRLNFKIVKIIIAIGISPFIMQLITCLVQIINNNVLKSYGGDYAIGAMATVNGIFMLCLMPIFGITQGAQPIIGYNYGARNYNRVKEALNKSKILALVLLSMAYLVIQIFPQNIIKTFSSDENILGIAVNGLRLYTMFMPAIAIGMVGTQFFQAIGKAKIALILSLLRQVIFLIPLIAILTKMIGLSGVWIAQSVADLLAAIVIMYFVKKETNEFPENK